MVILPREGERLWDSWILRANETWHLFYLASSERGGRVAHAVSADLLRWRRRPDIIPPHWPFTGMVVEHDGRYVMALGEEVDGVQTTRFYESRDLDHWRAMRGVARLVPKGPHYLEKPNRWRRSVPWRDPFLFRDESDGCWHALLCAARPGFGPDDTGAALARVRTRDFRSWEHLPPVDAPTGRFCHVEVPEAFEFHGVHYLLFSTGSCYGIRVDTPTRKETVGTYYLRADAPEGPYRVPEECLLVGAGQGRMGAYVARTLPYGDSRVLYHHIRKNQDEWDGVWGTPKTLCQDADGNLHAGFFPGLWGLGKPEAIAWPPAAAEPPWTADSAGVRCRSAAMGASCRIADDQADVLFECVIVGVDAARCAVVLRDADARGVAVTLDFAARTAEVGEVALHPVAGWGRDASGFVPGGKARDCRVIDLCGWPLRFGAPVRLTVLARHACVEAYLDGRWVFTAMMPEAARAGGLCLAVERGEAFFSELRLHRLEPLEPSASPGEIAVR